MKTIRSPCPTWNYGGHAFTRQLVWLRRPAWLWGVWSIRQKRKAPTGREVEMIVALSDSFNLGKIREI